MSACMSVCLSARTSQKPHTQTSRNFLHMLTMVMARSSSNSNAMRYVLPVLGMTSCFHIMGQAKAPPIGRILKVTYQGAAQEAKTDVYDCLVIIIIFLTL